MQQPLIHPRDDRNAYEYTIQATEDHHAAPSPTEDAPRGRGSPVWRSGSTPNYKPTPLRWPFITAVIALLLVGIVLVVVAEKKMPDSDGNAQILGIHPNATQPVRLARAVVFTNTSTLSESETTVTSTTLSVPVVATTASQTPESSSTSSGQGRILVQNVETETGSQTPTAPLVPPIPTSSVTGSSLSGPGASTSSVRSSETQALSVSSSQILESTEMNANRIGTYPASTTSLGSVSTTLVSSSTPSVSVSTTPASSSTRPASITSSASLPSGAQLVPISVSVSKFTTNVTVPVTVITYTAVFSSVETVVFTSESTFASTFVSTVTTLKPTTFHSQFTANGTQGSMPVSTGTATQVSVITVTSSMTTEIVGVSTRTALGTFTATSTITGVVIPSVGEVTITYYSTILPAGDTGGVVLPVTQPADPVKVTGVEVIEGGTVGIVQTQGPVVIAVSDEVQTVVVGQQVSTGVERVGGSVVTNVVVFTPTPGDSIQVVTNGATPVTVVNRPDPVTAVTVVDGVQRTIVETPPPQTVVRMEGGVISTIFAGQLVTSTVVNNVGGTPVTRVIVTTPAGPPFLPISYTVVRDAGGGTLVTEVVVTTPTGAPGQPITLTAVDVVGGTPVTQVVVTTANAAFQPVSFTITTNVGGTPTVITVTPTPTTIVETINGTPVTRVTTPPVTSFTTTVGGTLTTQTVVTTPTGTEPLTLTFVSTLDGTLSTFTTTFPATTFLTTISGTVRTITSTPPPSTLISTRAPSTRTFTSTATPTTTTTPSSASRPATPRPTVISSVRVFGWTEADIFLGTFLPPLLGVALVIPLRIIDLNAKLYQPFQTLANPRVGSGGGAAGAETLLLQYTGLMAFVTPVLTLLQGHPVPFLTTLMVGCASFMVPLATEAVGLKLHGECYLNTASAGCGPALGVSPVPAHALVGLMGAVVVMLVLVLVFVGRWVTGLYANPWSIAGAASLARSPYVRIQQDGERGMKRAVKDKLYGLGYFQNEAGREEYGIVLMDEAGRGLHDDGGLMGDSESEMSGGPAKKAKWGGSSQQLPFMCLRYPWRIIFILFQLAILIFVIYYHAYYRGGIRDDGKLWLFLNSNTFGVRFVSAVIGVIIAFCWQSFFLSVSAMTPYLLLSLRTQPPGRSILFTPSTNPFSGVYSSLRHRQPFLFVVSLAAILSEFLPVILSNVPFNLAQTGTAATVCAVLSCIFLGFMLAVLGSSFFVRYPPMPVDPRCIAGLLWYVSKSSMLEDFEGVSRLEGKERERRVKEMGRRYFYGVLVGEGEGRRLGVDCDIGGAGEDGMGYQGAQGAQGHGMWDRNEQY